MIGVCLGGSDIDQTIHPLPANLSCDAYKAHLIDKNKLSISCEGLLINPLELPEFPCLFDLDKRTGELMPKVDYTAVFIENNYYVSIIELVKETIEILNLNCDRLKAQRLAVLNQYNQVIKKARSNNDQQIHSKLAKHWFQQRWLPFFTTRRILLDGYAEDYLQANNFSG